MEQAHGKYVAFGSRLVGVPEVETLGVKPNFHDYTPLEQQQIYDSSAILYPTLNYSQLFTTMGKRIFPSLETYLYADEKMKQTTLFNMLSIPHPKTRFYLQREFSRIQEDFAFPFIAKIPRASARGRGVFKINSSAELECYLLKTKIAYIQEYIPHEKDLRVVLINYEPVLAYWRKRTSEDLEQICTRAARLNSMTYPMKLFPWCRILPGGATSMMLGLICLNTRGTGTCLRRTCSMGARALREKIWF